MYKLINMLKFNINTMERNIIYFSFFGVLLSYPIQVIFENYTFTLIVYSSILFISTYQIIKTKVNVIKLSFPDLLLFIFTILVFIGVIREYILTNDALYAVRMFMIYILPIVFMYTIVYNTNKVSFKFLILLFCILVASESLYEFFNNSPSWFENKNFEYVFHLTGQELPQLLGSCRHNGIMDHIHVTSTVIALGFMISFSLYLFHTRGVRYFYLIFSLLFFLAIILLAVKLTLISLFIWFTTVFILTESKRKVNLFLFSASILFVTIFLLTFDQKLYFWSVSYLQYLPDILLNNFNILELVQDTAKGNSSLNDILKLNILFANLSFIDIIFGLGFGKIAAFKNLVTDDLFFIQFFFQLGLLNSIVFLVIIFFNFKRIFYLLKGHDTDYRILVSFGFILTIFISLLHSGVFLRKQIYLLFFFFIIYTDYLYKNKHIEKIGK